MNEITIIGAANQDIVVYPQSIQKHDSSPSSMSFTAGGVARNICENLSRFYLSNPDESKRPTLNFISAVNSLDVLSSLHPTVVVENVIKSDGGSHYISVHEPSGDMLYAFCDTSALDSLTPEVLKQINLSDDIVVDCNVSESALQYLCGLNKRLFVEGVSMNKCLKVKPYLSHLYFLKVNGYEASSLLNHEYDALIESLENQTQLSEDQSKQLEQIAKLFLEKGIKHVVISFGECGFLYATDNIVHFHKTIKTTKVVNTSGAGDSLMATAVYSIYNKLGHKDFFSMADEVICQILSTKDAVYKGKLCKIY